MKKKILYIIYLNEKNKFIMLKKQKKRVVFLPLLHHDNNLKNNKNHTKNRSSKFLFTPLLHLIYYL